MSETKELNLEQKVTVKSIAGWNVGFPKLTETGDALIAPGGSARFTRNEIITQVQNGNKLFVGIDGMGSHATLYIEDADTRKELEFDTDEWSGDDSVDIQYDEDTANGENYLDDDDDYSYQATSNNEEKYDARSSEELADLQ